jgi:hypothetical protein
VYLRHTNSFVRALNDPQVKRDLKSFELVFVLDSDEWRDVRGNLKGAAVDGKYQGIPIDKLLARLKENAGNGPVFDPEFLDTLPGRYYFMTLDEGVEFPNVYSNGKFSDHAMNWVRTQSPYAFTLYSQFETESR